MKTKKHGEKTADIDNDIASSVGEIDTLPNKEEAQLQRLAASIRKILSGRRAHRHLAPEVPCRDDETSEDADSEGRSVEWMMRLML